MRLVLKLKLFFSNGSPQTAVVHRGPQVDAQMQNMIMHLADVLKNIVPGSQTIIIEPQELQNIFTVHK